MAGTHHPVHLNAQAPQRFDVNQADQPGADDAGADFCDWPRRHRFLVGRLVGESCVLHNPPKSHVLRFQAYLLAVARY
jgi:hypothetical protein